MRKKGMTLVEVTVAMAIFVTITTLVVGAFVTVTRMKSLTSVMRESQQKIRVANEMVTRLSRQANAVTVADGGKTLNLYFANNDWITAFKIKEQSGEYSLFINDNNTTDIDLLGGVTILNNNDTNFEKVGGIPPILNFELSGKIKGVSDNPYYSNDFALKNSVILESVK